MTTQKFRKLNTVITDQSRPAVALRMLRGSIMKDGLVVYADRTVRRLLWLLKELDENENPTVTFYHAVHHLAPRVAIRIKKVAGTKYSIPAPFTTPHKDLSIAIKWLLTAARKRKGGDLATRLFFELQAALKNQGPAVSQRDQMHAKASLGRPHLRFL